MSKPVIALHGNCIADCFVDVLSRMPSIVQAFDVDGTTLFRKPMSQAVMGRCVLLITQDRLGSWSLPVPIVRDRLPPGCVTLKVPNIVLSSLWPFTCVDPRDRVDQKHPLGRYPRTQADRVALEIMRTVSDPSARRAAYLAVDLSSRVDFQRYHEIQTQQMVEMERTADIQVAAHVLTTFRKQRLFFAAHHPTPALVLYLITQIVAHPLFAPFRRSSMDTLIGEASAAINSIRPFHGEEVPIHPQVARFFGLEWWSPELVYHIDRTALTFEQWVDHYMREPLPDWSRASP